MRINWVFARFRRELHMSLAVHTARLGYPGNDRLDVTRETGDRAFAPSWDIIMAAKRQHIDWPQYVELYTQEMRASYRGNRPTWDLLLGAPRVVLLCACPDPATCHRMVLGRILAKLGARFYGEITEWDVTVEEPLFGRMTDANL